MKPSELQEMIIAIYKLHSSGGALHIVLDDENVENENIKWCINNSIKELKENKQLYLDCANNLLKMSKKQRYKVIQIAKENLWNI
jgi:hypothetical protein